MHTLHTPHARDFMGTKVLQQIKIGVYVSMEHNKSTC
jgi:hypothetical protein